MLVFDFDESVLRKKVIPPLVLAMRDEKMIIHTLPSILKINERITDKEFQTIILPTLSTYFSHSDMQELYYQLINNLYKICSRMTNESRTNMIVPMLIKALQNQNVAIQACCLKQIIKLTDSKMIDKLSLDNKILPQIAFLCKIKAKIADSTDSTQIININNFNKQLMTLKVHSLICLSKLFKHFNINLIKTIIKVIFDTLEISGGPVNCNQTAILMSALGTLDAIAKFVDAIIVAHDILPNIIPYLVNSHLKDNQHKTYVFL